ncbi:MAG: hypothetical protein KJ060_21095 [Candidatus Hydrogenedentes bacterium]|nr:hypothetical protein [Candidatus Hydrogenedentota bacterium]
MATPHESFYFEYQGHPAFRKGNWKIVRESPDAPWQIFNLAEGMAEENNVAGESPERVEAIGTAFQAYRESFPH